MSPLVTQFTQWQQDYYYPDQEVVYLRQFYIDRPMRRRGLGTAAYELLAKERFRDREVAVDVLATNPDGQKFWAHIGFTPYFTSMKSGSSCAVPKTH